MAAASWLLLDVTSGAPIAAQNADERRDPASLTKLMTAYLVFAALRDKAITPSQIGHGVGARVARRGLADVHRAAQARCRSTSCCAA